MILLALLLLTAAPTKMENAPLKTGNQALKAELVKVHGEAQRERIERGVNQVAALWRKDDGDLSAFVKEQFVADPALLDQTFARFQANFEQVDGHMLEIGRELRKPTELDVGPLLKADPLFAGYDASARVTEDLFAAKIGFAALLNFPLTTLQQRLDNGPKWSRREWAEARLAGRFARRVPGEIQQQISQAQSTADLYIAEYNVWMHHLVDDKGQRLFPKGKRLISH